MSESISISTESNRPIDGSLDEANSIEAVDIARHEGVDAPDEPPPPPTTGATFDLDEAVIAGSLLSLATSSIRHCTLLHS